jgi:ATP-dependent Clp protease ATP-binding subunit ClpA
MFERFTHAARTVVVGAQDEARRLKHGRIGTEHLVLAMLRVGGGAATALGAVGITIEGVEAAIARLVRPATEVLGAEDAAALRAIGIDLDEVRARIEENFGPVPLTPPPDAPRRWRFGLRRRAAGVGAEAARKRLHGHVPFSPRAKKVLELSLREALRLKHKHIDDQHILLGVLRENEGLGARILADAGVDFDVLRARLETALREAA